jgi:ribosome-associated toxin RatA of RatAB toxin-antitoxin module
MRARVVALLVGLLALPALAEAEEPASARASVLGERIDVGTVSHPEHGVQWGRAEAVVDARPDDVLAVLHDYSQYAGLFPYFQKSKVLSQRGSDAIVYLEAKVLHGAATLWSQVRMRGNQSGDVTVVEARMMKGKGNIDQLLARWEVSPVNGGEKSLVVFQLLVDPDLPVPDGIVSDEMRKGAGKAMRALRQRVYQRVSYASRRPSAT